MQDSSSVEVVGATHVHPGSLYTVIQWIIVRYREEKCSLLEQNANSIQQSFLDQICVYHELSHASKVCTAHRIFSFSKLLPNLWSELLKINGLELLWYCTKTSNYRMSTLPNMNNSTCRQIYRYKYRGDEGRLKDGNGFLLLFFVKKVLRLLELSQGCRQCKIVRKLVWFWDSIQSPIMNTKAEWAIFCVDKGLQCSLCTCSSYAQLLHKPPTIFVITTMTWAP